MYADRYSIFLFSFFFPFRSKAPTKKESALKQAKLTFASSTAPSRPTDRGSNNRPKTTPYLRPETQPSSSKTPAPALSIPSANSDVEAAVLSFITASYRYYFKRITSARQLFSSASDPQAAVQAVCEVARKRDEVEPLPGADVDRLWAPFKEPSPMIQLIGADPHNFDPSPWLESGVLSTDTVAGKQQVYLRRRSMSRLEYLSTMEGYILARPVDAGWACARLAADGYGELAERTLNRVMQCFGYNLAFTFDKVKALAHDQYSDWYVGWSLSRGAEARLEEDAAAKGSSRHLNYSRIEPGDSKAWEAWTVVPLCQEGDRRAYRQDRFLSYPEAILGDCLPFSTMSARGGFAPFTHLPARFADSCRHLMASLPGPVPHVPANALRQQMSQFYDDTESLFEEMRMSGQAVGPAIDPAIFMQVKDRLVQHLNTVQGRVISLTVMKDLPQEVHQGRVNAVMFPLLNAESEAGRALAIHDDMMHQLFTAYYEEREDIGEDIRDFLGPYVDFWALIIRHRWFGLLLVILGRLLRALNPLIIHGWSSHMSSVFRRRELADLLVEMDGVPLSLALLKNKRIKEMQYSPKDKKFLFNAGKLIPFRIGNGPEDIFAVMPTIDFGHQGYRPILRIHRQRFQYLTMAMSAALNRIAAATVNKAAPGTLKTALLEEIKEASDALYRSSGITVLLEETRAEVIEMEKGHAALLGRFVADEEAGSSKRKTYPKSISRNCGPRAQGAAGSVERRSQLREWIEDAEEREGWGLEPAYIQPNGWNIRSEEYYSWFMGVQEGTSFTYSANAISNENRFDIGAFKAQEAAQVRVEAVAEQSWEQFCFDKAIGAVLETLSKPQKEWELSPAWVRCSKCNKAFLRKDKNETHICSPEETGKVTMGANQLQFRGTYLRLLYPHDLPSYEGVSHLATPAIMTQHGYSLAPAAQFLVDEKGDIRPEVPEGILPSQVTGNIWYRQAGGSFEASEPKFVLSMAIDIAVKEASEGRFGKVPYAGSRVPPATPMDHRNIHVYRETTVDHAIRALTSGTATVTICHVCFGHVNVRSTQVYQHKGCGPNFEKVNASQTPSNFFTYIPKKFIDLPPSIMRAYVYQGVALKLSKFLDAVVWST
ncbi:hypothetical protein M408DRAFT_10023 [Serendipita vermifera MAFF 305830]|uniref:Uncharacterized protein n=1 Tax=Serendipita vermifera MAFF 305830 TaxID=933852 RepID=A0A0C3B1W7_SERVB|nr:hypothetical protein M408DRAFT_10023 [Serendipita vermifera MAFF 305830]